jgi:hypothetical protein
MIKKLSLLSLVIFAVSCGPIREIQAELTADLQPPRLLSVQAVDEQTLQMTFDETAELVAGELYISPEIDIQTLPPPSKTIRLSFGEAMIPGLKYCIDAVLKDENGNTVSFLLHFYGFNGNLPALLINEFITQGSSTHPDLVELYVIEEGNLAGICLYRGTAGSWDSRIIFPDHWVESGDYVLVHFKPEEIPEETNETELKDESGGLDACNEAWDYWVEGGEGLSGNNDVLGLYSCPEGNVIDAVVYSNRTSESDEKYRGFGSRRMMERVDEITAAGAWNFAGVYAAPEDAVDPEDSTSTRSICRSSNWVDSDGKSDWHIVPTRGSTFGFINSDEVYE